MFRGNLCVFYVPLFCAINDGLLDLIVHYAKKLNRENTHKTTENNHTKAKK